MKRALTHLVSLLLFMTSCSAAQTVTPPKDTPTAVPYTLTVDPKMDMGPISPYIYGSNYGPWTAVPVDMLPAAINSHITVLRWPGGEWGDQNDIQTYQLDSFIALCKQMGAIPTISVRLLDGTPEAAAALVNYANIQMGYKIEYWGIGNEPTLYEAKTKQTYDTVRFNREWRAIAEAMKAVDPTIKLLGPELSQWGTGLISTQKDSSGRDWMTEFLKANGDLVDVVTVHRYPLYSATGKAFSVDDLRNNLQEWNGMVKYLRELIHTITGRDLPVAFTEVNSTSSPTLGGVASPDSFYNAIWYADVLSQMIKQNVFMVNQFILANRNGGLGLIYNNELRPTYYVFPMYSHFGTEQVFASSGTPDVDIVAAKRQDGTLTIMVINLSDSEQRVPLEINGLSPASSQVWLFDKDHNAEDMGKQAFPQDGRVVLPAQSISLYAIGK